MLWSGPPTTWNVYGCVWIFPCSWMHFCWKHLLTYLLFSVYHALHVNHYYWYQYIRMPSCVRHPSSNSQILFRRFLSISYICGKFKKWKSLKPNSPLMFSESTRIPTSMIQEVSNASCVLIRDVYLLTLLKNLVEGIQCSKIKKRDFSIDKWASIFRCFLE